MLSRKITRLVEFAAALARRELSFRSRVVQNMVLCALVLHPIPEDVAENVASYARELGVEAVDEEEWLKRAGR